MRFMEKPVLRSLEASGVFLQVGHIVSVAGAAFGFGAATYLEQWFATGQNVAAVAQDPKVLKDALAMAMLAGCSAVLLLAKQSFLRPPASLPPIHAALPKNPVPAIPPPAPRNDRRLFGSLAAVAMLYLVACPGGISPNVIPPSIDLGVCVLENVSVDVALGKPWEVVVEDVAAKCGTDITSVEKVWAAHTKAEIREGFVPKPLPINNDGGAP